jgi:fructose-bisphosphate aldolase class II
MLLNPSQTRSLFGHALANRYAILAVNADSPAAVFDVLEAARECAAPVIIETSLWQLKGRSFGAGDALLGLQRYAADLQVLATSTRFKDIPVVLHTDHIKGPETVGILQAALPLYSSISIDSSEMTEAENIQTFCDLCAHASRHLLPLALEMEAGVDDGLTPLDVTQRLLGAVESKHPGKLALWAPGVGTRHGFSEEGFPAFSAGHVAAQAAEAAKICGRPIGIALHGSSGLPEEHLLAAVQAGVAKVNWSSESLLIRSQAAQEYYATHTAELDKKHPAWKATAMDNGLQEFIAARYLPKVEARIRLLGGAGQGRAFVGAPGVGEPGLKPRAVA